MKKSRLDVRLVELGLAASRERAQALILSGAVLVNDAPATKPGHSVPDGAQIRLRVEDHPYVSRGALKLVAALDAFQVEVSGRIGLDVGASTGGFTEVLLLRGATRVHAVDVGHNQLAWKIRSDARVRVLEKVNARSMGFELIGEKVGVIVMDVSFISLDKILPQLRLFSTVDTDWVALVKPQFEVGKDKIGKGGIVHSETDRKEALDRVLDFARSLGLTQLGLINSPITGTDGNQEYLVHWRWNGAHS